MGYLHENSRELIDSDMDGKTVLNAFQRASNVIDITFTDGSYLEIWSESGPHGLAINDSIFFIPSIISIKFFIELPSYDEYLIFFSYPLLL